MVNNLFTPFSLACLAIAVAAVVSNVALVAMRYSGLPEEVPAHYGFFGRPDRWGSKAIMWLYALLPALTLLLMAGPMITMLTTPHKETDLNRVRVSFRLFAAMAAYLSVGTLVITTRAIAVAEKQADGLGRMVAPLFIAGLMLITVLFLLPL